MQEGENGAKYSNNKVLLGTRTIPNRENQNPKVVSATFANKLTGTITLVKKDLEDSNINLKGAKFKIGTSQGGYLTGTGLEHTYNATWKDATEYETNEKGEIVIEGVEIATTYKFYETKTPDKYLLEKQTKEFLGKEEGGTETTIDGTKCIYFDTKDLELKRENRKSTILLKNVQIISISGFVWTENNPNKAEQNSEYNQNVDIRLKDVAVYLIQKHTGSVFGGKPINTNENGYYEFKDVCKKSELKDYYVRFDYSKTEYKDSIPVAFNKASNGSKALMQKVAEKDVDLNGIATTYTGSTDEAQYGLSALYNTLYNSKTNTLENVNLGLRPIYYPDYLLTEDLDEVKVSIKGYDYVYKYGQKGNKNAVGAPMVNYELKGTVGAYTRDIYPSDIAYGLGNDSITDNLQVQVRYRIDITNTEETSIEELYKEDKLYITNLTDKYDSSRYTLVEQDGWKETTKDATDGNVKKYSIATMQDVKNWNGIVSQKQDQTRATVTSYITFSVNRAALNKLLSTNETYEEFPTQAFATGYHKYTRKDYSWEGKSIEKPNASHQSIDKDKYDEAPYLRLRLGENRKITGTVFKDDVTEERKAQNEKVGDGIYNNNESVVENVIVELLDASGNEVNIDATSHLYNTQRNGTAKITDAITKTDENGNYTLQGIVPGEYYLKFTYGQNGNYVVKDQNGNIVEQGSNLKTQLKDGTMIDADKYKSTIISGDIKEKLNDTMWYTNIGENYSVAKDYLDVRKDDKENSRANTSRFKVLVEKTPATNGGTPIIDSEGRLNDNTTEFKAFNFGIIERPEQKIRLEKIVTNMSLVNAQNNNVFSGNPKDADMQGVSDLAKDSTEGSRAVKAELNEEAIYGSTLKVTYKVNVINESDVNYYTDDYYWYGTVRPDVEGKRQVTLTPTEIKDYLDKTLEYDSSSIEGDATITVESDSKEIDAYAEVGKIKVKDLTVKGLQKLYRTDSQSFGFAAERILSTEDDDMTVRNIVVIEEGKVNTSTDDKDTRADEVKNKDLERTVVAGKISAPKAEATVTITPPTGKDMQSEVIYAIAGIAALVMLSTGIVVIKKKAV